MKKGLKIFLITLILIIAILILILLFIVYSGERIDTKKIFQTTDSGEGNLINKSFSNNRKDSVYNIGIDGNIVYRIISKDWGGFEDKVSELYYIDGNNEDKINIPLQDIRYITVFGDELNNWFAEVFSTNSGNMVYKLEGKLIKRIDFEDKDPWSKHLIHNNNGEWLALLTRPYSLIKENFPENLVYKIDIDNLKANRLGEISGSNSHILINELGDWFFWNRPYVTDGTFGPGFSFLYLIKEDGTLKRIKKDNMEICRLYNGRERCDIMKGHFFDIYKNK